MRKLIAAVALAGTLAATVAVAQAATRTVRVGDNWFVRDTRGTPTVNARAGDTIRFRWVGNDPHNVAVQRGPQRFSSGRPQTSGSYSRRVSRRGTYLIICQVHGRRDQAMRLRVR